MARVWPRKEMPGRREVRLAEQIPFRRRVRALQVNPARTVSTVALRKLIRKACDSNIGRARG